VKRDFETNKKLRKQGYAVLRFFEHSIENNLDRCYLKIHEILIEKGYKNYVL
jgi:very-short-patch-repair endonuclease